MRITGWTIEGFGTFRDFEVRGLPPGPTVFLGPNEAGKTTLLAFLRGVLFGYGGTRRTPEYPPLRGGRHGGRLFLECAEGALTIERQAGERAARVYLPGGSEGTEDDLRRVLGGCDGGLFRSVFAFSLTELQSFASLSEDGVKDRIFSAGIAGAGRSAREVLRRLDAEADRLLRPRAGARINELAQGLEDGTRLLAAAKQAAARYPELVAEEERWRRVLGEADGRADTAEREMRRAELLLELWPDWVELREAEQRRATLRGRPDDALDAVADAVEALQGGIELYRDQLRQREAARAEQEQAQAALDAAFRDLGGDWNEARLERFDRSIPRREEVRDWEKRLQEAGLAAAEAKRERDAAGAALREAEQARTQAEREVPAVEPPDPEALRDREAAVRRLRANLGAHASAEAKRDARRTTLEERERALRDAAATGAPASAAGPAWLLLAAAVAAAALGAWKLLAGDVATAVVALLLAAGAGYAWVRTRGSERDDDARARREQELAARGAALERARQELDAAEDELRRLAESVARDAAHFDLRSPSLHDVEELDARIAAAREERRRWDEARKSLAAAATRLEAAREAERHALERWTELDRSSRTLREAWGIWTAEAGLPRSLSPQGVLDFFGTLREAAEWLARRDEARDRLEALERGIQEWEAGARRAIGTARGEAARRDLDGEGAVPGHTAAEAAAPEPPSGEALVLALLGVRRRCEEDREARAALAAAGEEAKRTAARLAARLGHGPDAAALRDALAEGRLDAWREDAAAAARELALVREERDEAIRRHRDAEAQRQALEVSADVAALEAERAALVAELEEAAHAWRVAAVARALIEETLRDFERTRQPRVLAAASGILSTVTTGRYERILQDEAASDLVIVDRSGGRRRTGELSRGTAEQLYLALRLALVAEFAQRTAALPLVLDDVLVNFDPGRARAMAEALAGVARDHQVLLFTCHPATAELLADVHPATHVHRLDRMEPAAVAGPGRAAPDAPGARSTSAAPGVPGARGVPAAAGEPAADDQLAEARAAVLGLLAGAARPLRKAEILAVTGIDDRLWSRLIRDLTDAGEVVQIGERRGAAYAASGGSA